MASQYIRMADGQTGAANKTQESDKWLDLGAYRELGFQLLMLSAGSAGNILVEHSATAEDDNFVTLTGVTWFASGTGGYQNATDFLRYVRWFCDGSVAGNPVFTIDDWRTIDNNPYGEDGNAFDRAYAQWTLEEFENGTSWQHLSRGTERVDARHR